MKICFIVGTLGRGGAERQLLYMLRALKKCGIAARVLCLTKNESYEDEIKSIGINVEWIGSHKNRGLRLLSIINNLRKNPRRYFAEFAFLHKYLRRFSRKVSKFTKHRRGSQRSDK